MSNPSCSVAERVRAGLSEAGYCAIERALPPDLCEAVRAEMAEMRDRGAFRAAGIGRGEGRRIESQVRRDGIAWLEPASLTPTQANVWSILEELRSELNRSLLLGLWDLEGHYAIYPAGAFYRRHLDRFADDSRRTVSVLLYFNPEWKREDGGLLALDLPEGRREILPESGTAVFFLSDRIAHEVTESRRERMSFAGWYRQRP